MLFWFVSNRFCNSTGEYLFLWSATFWCKCCRAWFKCKVSFQVWNEHAVRTKSDTRWDQMFQSVFPSDWGSSLNHAAVTKSESYPNRDRNFCRWAQNQISRYVMMPNLNIDKICSKFYAATSWKRGSLKLLKSQFPRFYCGNLNWSFYSQGVKLGNKKWLSIFSFGFKADAIIDANWHQTGILKHGHDMLFRVRCTE
jgi:hypothetical protein